MYSTIQTNSALGYDPEEEYNNALAALQQVKNNLPAYDSRYEQSLQALYQEISERPKFSYNPNDDALYQSYKQSYARQGSLAMEDAMGQAAGLTGGYGNSYAQAVGQQQYGAYLQKLSEIYPETYGMAYDRYLKEGDRLQEQYGMMSSLAEEEYQRYQDRLNDYYRQVAELQERVDVAYNRSKAEQETAYQREQDAYQREQDALKRQDAAYERLAEMIVTMGYTPDSTELSAAGMSQKQAEAYLNYYKSLNTVAVSGGSKKKADKESKAYTSALAQAQKRLDTVGDVEQVNGEIARKVARGELDSATAQQIIITLTKQKYG